MIWAILPSDLIHHGEFADPDLLDWIKGTLDDLIGLGSWTVGKVIGLLILLMPLSTVVLYLDRSRRSSNWIGRIAS